MEPYAMIQMSILLLTHVTVVAIFVREICFALMEPQGSVDPGWKTLKQPITRCRQYKILNDEGYGRVTRFFS